ncbi:MAG: zinc-ribbon domain containing protein [Acidobacteriota bacterium]
MAFEDKILACKECGSDFVFTAGEQEFYAEKGFQNIPARCPDCRRRRKNETRGRSGFSGEREMHEATCASCGCDTKVPFRPSGDRPVYCSDCYRKEAAGNR